MTDEHDPDREYENADPAPVRRMLAELDFPVADGWRAEVLLAAVAALEPLFSLLVDGEGPHAASGERPFAMFHLASRSLTDLMTSAHLASHCHLQQAYAAMRPVLENCDLMELFTREPDKAGEWINDPMPGKAFSRRAVRKLLGQTEPDEVYDYLSEVGSHPRFAGSRLAGLMHGRSDGITDRKAVLRIGPFFPEHPASVLVFILQFQVTMRLGLKFQHLVEASERVTLERWSARYLETAKAAARGCGAIRFALIELGESDDEELRRLAASYDPTVADLEAAGSPRH